MTPEELTDAVFALASGKGAAARIEALEAALKVIARKTSPTFGRGVMSGEEAASIARAALTPEAPHAD